MYVLPTNIQCFHMLRWDVSRTRFSMGPGVELGFLGDLGDLGDDRSQHKRHETFQLSQMCEWWTLPQRDYIQPVLAKQANLGGLLVTSEQKSILLLVFFVLFLLDKATDLTTFYIDNIPQIAIFPRRYIFQEYFFYHPIVCTDSISSTYNDLKHQLNVDRYSTHGC